MIQEIIHKFSDTFLHNPNQFASGGIFLMAVGAIGALLRKIPQDIWRWAVHQSTVTLAVTDDQKAYLWIKLWIENQRIMKRTRHMDVFNRGAERYAILPAPGHHWMLYNGRILSVNITRTEEKKLGQTTRSEVITFKTIGRKQAIFRKLMADVHLQFIKQDEKKPELYAWGAWGDWQEIHSYTPRPIKSVIMPNGVTEKLIKDINVFKSSRDWYTEMGIPYRKGYLFYGPPGTGKTSLVTGLSSYYNANVYILKLADMSDAGLRDAIRQTEPNSFLIMEDIDCVSASRDRKKSAPKADSKKNEGVTLSGLLNVVDGLLSPSGAIFIMTTNHVEKLDPALLRPGRIDLKVHITYADESQKRELYSRFHTDECPREYLNKRMTMAELQQVLMEEKVKNSA